MHACSSLPIVMVIKGCQSSTNNDDYNEVEHYTCSNLGVTSLMMVKMASGIADGHICKTKMMSCNMPAILQLKSQSAKTIYIFNMGHPMMS